jgi:hypothetical protein
VLANGLAIAFSIDGSFYICDTANYL